MDSGGAEPPDPYQDLLDEARAERAVEERIRERWLRQQARDAARLTGVLTDLAEQRTVVTVRVGGAAQHQGIVTAVAVDHVTLRTRDGGTLHLALDHVVTVRPEPSLRFPAGTGARPAGVDRTLHEVLTRIVADRPRIAVVARGGGPPLAGELRAVGEDVATLRLDGTGDTAYLATATITELAVLDT